MQDGRGRKKAEEELTESDRQKLEMKKLEYKNERLRAENAFLKKLHELQRRRQLWLNQSEYGYIFVLRANCSCILPNRIRRIVDSLRYTDLASRQHQCHSINSS